MRKYIILELLFLIGLYLVENKIIIYKDLFLDYQNSGLIKALTIKFQLETDLEATGYIKLELPIPFQISPKNCFWKSEFSNFFDPCTQD